MMWPGEGRVQRTLNNEDKTGLVTSITLRERRDGSRSRAHLLSLSVATRPRPVTSTLEHP